MTHVVAEPCFDCKYTDCVVVCPVTAHRNKRCWNSPKNLESQSNSHAAWELVVFVRCG